MTTALSEQDSREDGQNTAGRVARVTGAVVDVEFPRGAAPALNNALTVDVEHKLSLIHI